MEIVRRGSEGEAVRKWQNFLLGLGLYAGGVDGIFGPVTEAATRAFQRKQRLARDAMVGPMTYGAALRAGIDPGLTDPLGGTSGPDWPPPPAFAPLVSNLERQRIFGRFRYQRIAPGPDDIRILGDWESRNLVRITLPAVPDQEVKRALQNVGTRFHLPRDQVDLLVTWGRQLVLGADPYRKLVSSLGGTLGSVTRSGALGRNREASGPEDDLPVLHD